MIVNRGEVTLVQADNKPHLLLAGKPVFLWDAVDNMPQPKDYLQVFRLSEENGLQIVNHTSEQPQFEMTYIVEAEKPVTAKVYIIDDGEHCTMLLAEEYWLKVL